MRTRATAGRVKAAPALSSAVCALLLAGCSSTGIGALAPPGPLPYQPANAIMPVGYSESLIGEDRYRIVVKGPLGTPRERMEKIATARAAEIGQDAKHKYFKVEGVQLTTTCQSYRRRQARQHRRRPEQAHRSGHPDRRCHLRQGPQRPGFRGNPRRLRALPCRAGPGPDPVRPR